MSLGRRCYLSPANAFSIGGTKEGFLRFVTSVSQTSVIEATTRGMAPSCPEPQSWSLPLHAGTEGEHRESEEAWSGRKGAHKARRGSASRAGSEIGLFTEPGQPPGCPTTLSVRGTRVGKRDAAPRGN